MKVLIKQNSVTPMYITLKNLLVPINRSLALFVAEEEVGEALGEVAGDGVEGLAV